MTGNTGSRLSMGDGIHGLTQRGGGVACLRAAHRQAVLTRLATANANEDPAVVLVQYVEEADGA